MTMINPVSRLFQFARSHKALGAAGALAGVAGVAVDAETPTDRAPHSGTTGMWPNGARLAATTAGGASGAMQSASGSAVGVDGGGAMEAAMLDHATLRTHDLERTRAFLETVLDLQAGYRPAFSFPGYWLYANDQPIVHLIPGGGRPPGRDAETIDHVAFRLADHDAMQRKLDLLSIPYSQMELPELGERRLFIRTLTGILLEFVFRDSYAGASSSLAT
jgi:glyoxylase I family protein